MSSTPKDINASYQQEANQEEIPNYDFNKNATVPSVIRNEEREPREPRDRNRCLFCCTPKVLMVISVIYLILGVIHAIAQIVFGTECRNLYKNLDSVNLSTLSYDPSKSLDINSSYENFNFGFYNELWISQTNDASATNATIQIRTVTKNNDVKNYFTTQVTPTTYFLHLDGNNRIISFFPFISIWARCAVTRVDLILPQQQIASNLVDIKTSGLDIKLTQNPVPYPYSINLETTYSDIDIENIFTTNASIKTTSGDIKGSITSNKLNIESSSGDIKVNVNTANTTTAATNTISPNIGLKSTSGDIDFELNVLNVVVRPVINVSATSGDIDTDIKLANGITDSQITIGATSGDVDLQLHDTFEGGYKITTTSGDVNVKTGNGKNHNRQGTIGLPNSQGFLNIGVTSGDVNVDFSN